MSPRLPGGQEPGQGDLDLLARARSAPSRPRTPRRPGPGAPRRARGRPSPARSAAPASIAVLVGRDDQGLAHASHGALRGQLCPAPRSSRPNRAVNVVRRHWKEARDAAQIRRRTESILTNQVKAGAKLLPGGPLGKGTAPVFPASPGCQQVGPTAILRRGSFMKKTISTFAAIALAATGACPPAREPQTQVRALGQEGRPTSPSQGSGFGTKADGGQVPAGSGTSAYQAFGCTNVAGKAKRNFVAEEQLPGAAHAEDITTTPRDRPAWRRDRDHLAEPRGPRGPRRERPRPAPDHRDQLDGQGVLRRAASTP